MFTARGHKAVRSFPALMVIFCGVLFTVCGCSSSHGLSPLQARDAVEKAPGVASATVTTGTDLNTLGKSYYINVRVQLQDGLSQADQRRLLEYSVRTGWATDIGHNPYGLRVRITASPPVNVQRVLEDIGVASSPAPHDTSFVLISAKTMNGKWGNWPAKAPSL